MNLKATPFKILFICTGNSARSIFGEYLIGRVGRGLFRSYSAGANPIGRVNPYAQRVLRDIYHIDASDARSKGFEELRDENFDFVILCALPFDKIDRLRLETMTRDIGKVS